MRAYPSWEAPCMFAAHSKSKQNDVKQIKKSTVLVAFHQ